MDTSILENYEFLDLTDIDDNEKDNLKYYLQSSTKEFLQLPWTSADEQEWSSENGGYGGTQSIQNGPMVNQNNINNTIVASPRTITSVAHVPPVTIYSQHPPATYAIPPNSNYQHPQNVFVSNVSTMHGYVTYNVPHYAAMPEPSEMSNRGHRGRSRGRGNKRNDMRLENNTISENNSGPAGFTQHQPFVPIPYHHGPPYYPPPSVTSHMQHPTAQHATGSPLYIAPVYPPIYSTYHHPGAQYYPPPNAHINPVMDGQQTSTPAANTAATTAAVVTTTTTTTTATNNNNNLPVVSDLNINETSNFIQPSNNTNTTNTSSGVSTPVVNSNSMDHINFGNRDTPAEKSKDNLYTCINGNTVISAADVRNDLNNETIKENSVVVSSVVTEIVKTESYSVSVENDSIAKNNNNKPLIENDVEKDKNSAATLTSGTVETSKVKEDVDSKHVLIINENNNVQLQQQQMLSQSTSDSQIAAGNISSSQLTTQETTSAPAGKSWASLFNKSSTSETLPTVILNEYNNRTETNSKPTKTEELQQNTQSFNNTNNKKVQFSMELGEFFKNYALDFRTISLQPRGLTNRSNYCYVNSILQALLACPPLYNLLEALPHTKRKASEKSPTPILDAMVEFVKEFTPLSAENRLNRREKGQRKDNIDIICGTAFEPSRIYKILSTIRSDTFIVEGRQEDAEEFFGYILNGLNDEILEITKTFDDQKHNCNNLSNGEIDSNGRNHDDIEWTVMGPKNKGSITRKAEFGRTPVSDIFRGQVRSRVHRMGDQVTDNVQPFFTLQLDIEKPNNVFEALEQLVNKDKLEGVTCWRTNKQVEAWQQLTIEELPPVLVLHLKCFHYKLDTCSKIIKALEFPIDLKLDNKLLASKTKYSTKQRQYKLFAIVYHDGKEASKGHYLTDTYHVGYGGWVRYDDAIVKAVQEASVLRPGGSRVPYLLFYRRSDTIGNQNQSVTAKP